MPRYLDHLLARLEAVGGSVEVRRLGTLGEVADEAAVIVNCTGADARELVPDAAVSAAWGQHVIVENPGLDDFFMEAPAARWAGIFPHGDHVVLGGVVEEDRWSLDPDPAVAEEIVRRCAAVDPRLAEARVLEHRVGLRPARNAIRFEEEPLGPSRCVHNYGHGGIGVGLSWGCARDVAALVTG